MLFQGFSFAPHPPPGGFKHPASWDELKPAIYISWFSWFINPQHMLVVLCCIQLYSYNMIRYVYVCIVYIYIRIYILHTHIPLISHVHPCPAARCTLGPPCCARSGGFFFIVIDKNRDLCTFRKIEGSNHFIPFLCGKCHVMSAISTKKMPRTWLHQHSQVVCWRLNHQDHTTFGTRTLAAKVWPVDVAGEYLRMLKMARCTSAM